MAFPLGMAAGDEVVALPGVMEVSWKSESGDSLFQAYVNGEPAAVTTHPHQRRLLVPYRWDNPVVVTLVAVLPENQDTDYSVTWDEVYRGSRARVRWLRQGTLPLGSEVRIYGDAGTGEIDYGEPLAVMPVWVGEQEKWGYGLDAFGYGDFGWSGTGAPGWGRGAWGEGEFGFDAEAMVFETGPLTLGRYQWAVRAYVNGQIVGDGDIATSEMVIDPLVAVVALRVENYDTESNHLTLRIE